MLLAVVIITYAFRIKVNGQVLIKNKIGRKCTITTILDHMFLLFLLGYNKWISRLEKKASDMYKYECNKLIHYYERT